MSDKPTAGFEHDPAVGKSPAQGVLDGRFAQTVVPQSGEPLDANTQKPSANDGTSVTGANAAANAAATASGELLIGPGTELGYYRLVKKLGEGGMGSVWQALHIKLEKLVAVKILPASWNRDPALLSRFEREMKAVGKLEHPNIVRAMDAGEFQGTHYLVMEFNEGQDLSAWVKQRGPQTVSNACEMVRQAALGLAHAHKAGLIHRDIKPSNLFLTKQGKVQMLDLGLARVQGDNVGIGQTITGLGQVLGTPDYMAPEQWEDTHAADARSDLYALGCTLFYLLTGRAPFSDEKHSSLVGKMKGHTLDPIPDLQVARREAVANRPKLANDLVSDDLSVLYLRLMSKQPAGRFATAEEFAQSLLPFGKSKPAASSADKHGAPASGRTDTDAPTAEWRAQNNAMAVQPKSPSTVDEPTFLMQLMAASSSTDQHEAPTIGDVLPQFGESGDSRPVLQSADHPTFPPNGSRRTWRLAAGGAAAMVLLGAIIITITNKDGTKTTIEVPDGASVEVSQDGKSVARLKSKPAPAMPKPAPVAGEEKPLAFTTPGFDQWVKQVAAMPAEQQVEAVSKKLVELNPEFDGKVKGFDGANAPLIENGVVVHFGFFTDNVTDISPVRALAGLTALCCDASGTVSNKRNGKLADLSPLKGMRLASLSCPGTSVSDLSPLRDLRLESLNVAQTFVTDLSPLNGQPMNSLDVSQTAVTDLSALKGMPLEYLYVASTCVTDLSPLKEMPLKTLNCANTHIADLSPLRDVPLHALMLSFTPDRDTELIRSIKTLESFNGKPAAEFCNAVEAYKLVAKQPLAFETPGFDQWVKLTAALPVNEQVKAVAKKLMELNPGFDGKLTPTTADGVVIGLRFFTDNVTDISPLQALVGLKSLHCSISKEESQGGLSNLSPLRGMLLTEINLSNTHVANLSPLKGMPLTKLNCYMGHVADLSPLKNMPLVRLNLTANPVSDLSPLLGMPLTG